MQWANGPMIDELVDASGFRPLKACNQTKIGRLREGLDDFRNVTQAVHAKLQITLRSEATVLTRRQ
jgi:hypothetical protein